MLVIRIPTEDVIVIDGASIRNSIIKDLKRLTRKVDRIMLDNPSIIRGLWCAGCKADCKFKRPSRWAKNRPASFDGYEKVIMNLDSVIEKVLVLLEME